MSTKSRHNWPPIGETPERKTGHTKSGTDNGASGCCECEFENALRAIKDTSATGEPIHQPGTAYRLKSIAGGNIKRRGKIACRCHIHQKRTDEDRWPRAVTNHEQCSKRNSRWRPHRRCTCVQRCQHQSELAGD